MRLQRVQVPEFRVLKDVDITFEKDFVPNIFPIGSQNGGGKSTLLQLIFVLLHCSVNPERYVFLRNMFHGFTIDKDSINRKIATIEIWTGVKVVKLEFWSYRDSALKQIIKNIDIDFFLAQDETFLNFSTFKRNIYIQEKIIKTHQEIKDLEQILNELEIIKTVVNNENRHQLYLQLVDKYNMYMKNNIRKTSVPSISEIEKVQRNIQKMLNASNFNLESFYKDAREIENILEDIVKFLHSKNLMYVCNYSANKDSEENEALLCHIENLDMNEANTWLKELSQKVFLAAPTTQVFLFFSQDNKKLLFKEPRISGYSDYNFLIKSAKNQLTGLFTYDFLAVELLIEAFKESRDRDFREAIEKGSYGNSYQTLLYDLNSILGNKKIKLDADLSGVSFQFDVNGNKVELYPEDLSHGELKRLGIYMWIKYFKIEDAIVLMDELEIAFHPDWQYQIISDLYQWSPSNQYIIATHSYELCQALTPAHVKEIEPKLLKQEAKIS